ncbi:unnamed protein product [Callosobruchus maculatus]|uniref:Uncharacterized protein n=1 Tax=Callosobruchus maculatus TaxID=64391 RepID=A0A653CV03_CALMS|nr:unnamed protein product [Callosobruchus maculatus]
MYVTTGGYVMHNVQGVRLVVLVCLADPAGRCRGGEEGALES